MPALIAAQVLRHRLKLMSDMSERLKMEYF